MAPGDSNICGYLRDAWCWSHQCSWASVGIGMGSGDSIICGYLWDRGAGYILAWGQLWNTRCWTPLLVSISGFCMGSDGSVTCDYLWDTWCWSTPISWASVGFSGSLGNPSTPRLDLLLVPLSMASGYALAVSGRLPRSGLELTSSSSFGRFITMHRATSERRYMKTFSSLSLACKGSGEEMDFHRRWCESSYTVSWYGTFH